MGAVAGLDDLVAKATGGNSGTPENIWWTKVGRSGGASISSIQNREQSLWTFEGQWPSGSTPPTTAAAPDNTTQGALMQADPGGGRQKWTTGFGCYTSSICASLILYDRLLHISGLSGTVTTAQAVGGAITRYTGAASWGNQAFIEVYSALGATPTTLTMTYTNDQGVAGQVSPTVTVGGTSFSEATRMWQIPLVAGDLGVRAIQDVTLAGTTGTAGNFGITIARPLALLSLSDLLGGGGHMTYLEQMPEVLTGACLSMLAVGHILNTPMMFSGVFSFVEA